MRWLAFLFAIAAAAQELSHTTPPRVISKVEPEYSEEARIGRLQGTVILEVTIRADGVPSDVKTQQSLGLELDEQAIKSVRQWRFQPATSHSEPVAAKATIEVNFRTATDPKSGHLTSASFDMPAGASRPVLVTAKFPRAWERSPPVTLMFEVNESGSPVYVRAKETGTSEWQHDLIEALDVWKFTPAIKDGSPIRVSAEFTSACRDGARGTRAL